MSFVCVCVCLRVCARVLGIFLKVEHLHRLSYYIYI